MRESRFAERFNLELEQINTLTIGSKDSPRIATLMEEEETQKELAPIIELAETLINTDFSGDSRIKESFLQHLLKKFPGRMPDSTTYKPLFNTELSNDELDKVAGGLTGQQTNGASCAFCGYQSSGVKELGICQNCGHSRTGDK